MEDIRDSDLLVALDYLLTHHHDALTKWAWGKTHSKARTTYQKLLRMQERIEGGGELTPSNRKYIQMVFGSKHGYGTGCKIEEWKGLEEHRKKYLERLSAKRMIKALQGKIPVRFKDKDPYKNAIGWIDTKAINKTMPPDIGRKVFMIPAAMVPEGFQTGLIYEVVVTGVTSGGAIKVKPI